MRRKASEGQGVVKEGRRLLYRSPGRNRQGHVDGIQDGKSFGLWHQWLLAPKSVETKAGKDEE